jgi:hypothetical protein
MSATDPSQQSGRHRRTSKGRVRGIEYSRRAVTAEESGTAGSATARYVGRVGALAVAFGVGSAAAAMPLAFADTTGSGGSTGSNADSSAGASSSSSSRAETRQPRRGSSSGTGVADSSTTEQDGDLSGVTSTDPVIPDTIEPGSSADTDTDTDTGTDIDSDIDTDIDTGIDSDVDGGTADVSDSPAPTVRGGTRVRAVAIPTHPQAPTHRP